MLHLKIVSKQDIMFNIRDVVLIKSVCQNKTLLKIRGVDDGFIDLPPGLDTRLS